MQVFATVGAWSGFAFFVVSSKLSPLAKARRSLVSASRSSCVLVVENSQEPFVVAMVRHDVVAIFV